jgi:hypothetical protein
MGLMAVGLIAAVTGLGLLITFYTSSPTKIASTQLSSAARGPIRQLGQATVNQQTVASCVDAGAACLKEVPALARCEKEQEVCDQSARRRLDEFPPNQSPRATQPLMNEQQAVASLGWTGDTIGGSEMSYTQAQELYPELAASTTIVGSRTVWVISRYLSPAVIINPGYLPAGAPASTVTVSSESAIVDAASGIETDACTNCSLVPAGQ